jgi:dihydropteroate synthase
MTADADGPRPSFAGLPSGRCLVMGVVNVTPDSFSDGGAWLDPDKAIAHGLELAGQARSLTCTAQRISS